MIPRNWDDLGLVAEPGPDAVDAPRLLREELASIVRQNVHGRRRIDARHIAEQIAVMWEDQAAVLENEAKQLRAERDHWEAEHAGMFRQWDRLIAERCTLQAAVDAIRNWCSRYRDAGAGIIGVDMVLALLDDPSIPYPHDAALAGAPAEQRDGAS
jgi:hypothetical protein